MVIENELKDLESKIDKLIELLKKVKLENSSLRKKIVHLSGENIVLSNKKKKAANAVKKLIMQLQDELSCQFQK